MPKISSIAAQLALTVVVVALGLFAPVSQAQAVHECFILLRPDVPKPFVSNATECDRKTAPASTFKLPHALIALDTGVISADAVIPWDGTARDFKSWQRDHTLDSAMKWSVLPFFQRTARLIGVERMRKGLASLRYTSDTFDGDIATFWVNGDLVISPMEQLEFLRRLFLGTMPIAERHVSTVIEAIRMPPGQILNAFGTNGFPLAWPSSTIVRAKTGATRVNGEQVGWLVGALELNGSSHIFVARARSTGALDRTAAISVAQRGLNALKLERR